MIEIMKMLFTPIEGGGPLEIDFGTKQPGMGAIESPSGNGFYWLDKDGKIASVQFEEVSEFEDTQTLTTKNGEWVSVTVKNGAITIDSSIQQSKK